MSWNWIYLFSVVLLTAWIKVVESSSYTDQIESDLKSILTKNKSVPEYAYQGNGASSKVRKYARNLEAYILEQPCNNLKCGEFDREWGLTEGKIAHILRTLKGLGLPNTVENFELVINELMLTFKANTKINSDIIRDAALRALDERKDPIALTVLDLYPELTVSTLKVNCRNDDESSDYSAIDESIFRSTSRDGKPCGVHCCENTKDHNNGGFGADYQGVRLEPENSRVAPPEDVLDFFRENNHLSWFHTNWHRVSAQRNPRNKQGSRFYYAHKMLLYRYMVDRHINGLPELVPMDANAQSRSFKSRYNIDDASKHGTDFSNFVSAKENCRLNQQQFQSLRRDENHAERFKSSSLEKYSNELQFSYHRALHMVLAEACAGDGITRNHILTTFRVAQRDPLFYRLHLLVENKFDEHWATKRAYSRQDLLPAPGIEMEGVEVRDKCGKTEQVATFWETYTELGNQYKRVNHEEFSFVIRFTNTHSLRQRVIIRVFLALDKFVSTGKWFIELDKFVHQLTGQRHESIIRSEKLSSFTTKTDPVDPSECAWPQHMFIPRGTSGAPTKFRLIVFIHGLQDQSVNEGMTKETSNVFCGVESSARIKVDSRDYGFPFNRAWRGLSYSQVINNQNSLFGKVSSPISISFKGAGYNGKQCGQNPPTSSGQGLGEQQCFRRSCYRMSTSAVNRHDANNLCRDNGMALVSAVPAQLATKHRSQNRRDFFWTRHQRGDKCYLTEGRKWYLHDCSSSSQSGFNFLALCQKAVHRNRRNRHRRFRRQKL